MKRIITAFILSLLLLIGNVYALEWWNTTWLLRKPVTITNPNNTITYTNLPFSINGTNFTTPGCGIRITDNSNSLLPFEFENASDPYYGCNNNTLIFLSAAFPPGSTTIYKYYANNSNVVSGENVSGMMNSTYFLLLHMNKHNSTHVFDSSNNNATFNISGTNEFVGGKVGRGWSSGGRTSWLNISNHPELNVIGDFTFQAWVYTLGVGGGSDSYLFARTNPTATTGSQFHADGVSNFRWAISTSPDTNASQTCTVPGGFPANTWVLITAVRENATTDSYKIYYNDTLMVTCPDSRGINPDAGALNPFYIGSDWSGTVRNNNWVVDEVRILNRSMSQDEVTMIYRSGYSLGDEEVEVSSALGSCSGIRTTIGRRLGFFNEVNLSVLNGSMDGYIYFIDSVSTTHSYNFSISNVTYNICTYPSYANYSVYGQIQYQDNNRSQYSMRDYFLDAEVFDNVSNPLNLYLLDNPSSTRIEITIKDQYSTPKPDVVAKIQRYYPSENVYRTVTAPKSASDGTTSTYLVLYDVYYRFVLQQSGTILDTKPSQKISSTAFTLLISPGQLIDWMKYWNQVSGSVVYDNSTNNLTASYNDNSGYLKNVTFTVKRESAVASLTICSITNTTIPSGRMVCNIGNASTGIWSYSLIGRLTTGSYDDYVIASGILNVGYTSTKLFGECRSATNLASCKEGIFITMLLTISAVMVGVWVSPPASIVLMLSALTGSMLIGLFAISAQSIIGLILVGAIVIWKIGT